MTFKIREQREAKGMTMTELAEKTGICRTTLYFLEHNKDEGKAVSIAILNKIANVLEVPMNTLFFEDKV